MRIAGDQGQGQGWVASAEDRSVRLMVRSGSGSGLDAGPRIYRERDYSSPNANVKFTGISIERGEAWVQSWSIGM
jgi:hypothetical protein